MAISIQPLFIAVASVLALAACSSAPSTPKTGLSPSAATVGLDQSAAADPSAQGGANTGGTNPYGTIQKTDTGAKQQAVAEATEGVFVMGRDGTVWFRSGATDERYRTDADSCYAYARGQVDHDARIEKDVDAAFQSEAGGLGLAALRGRMNNFERSRRLPSLFNSCMVAKGYSRQ